MAGVYNIRRANGFTVLRGGNERWRFGIPPTVILQKTIIEGDDDRGSRCGIMIGFPARNTDAGTVVGDSL
jgi:hypothetical protein